MVRSIFYFFLFLFPGLTFAQTNFTTIYGASQFEGLGFDVAGLGDINLDGIPDFAVGRPDNAIVIGGVINASVGTVDVYSGRNGSLIYSINGAAGGDRFGKSIDSLKSDLTGDGVPDYVVGAPQSYSLPFGNGYVALVSGATGGIITTVYGTSAGGLFGDKVAGSTDINGDGLPDFIVGAPNVGVSQSGAVYVYSGTVATFGVPIFTISGISPSERFGNSVDSLGDINADGRSEFIVGAPGFSSNSGRAVVYSGMTGAPLFPAKFGFANDNFGFGVAGVGDVNIDGVNDFAIGAPQNPVGGVTSGYVKVYSGLNSTLLFTLNGTVPGGTFGVALTGGADFTSDGYPDIVVSDLGDIYTSFNSLGRVRVFSGINGTNFQTIFAPTTYDMFGYDIDIVGNINLDSSAELVVGAPRGSSGTFTYNGYAVMASATSLAATVVNLGSSCGNPAPTLTTSSPILGQFLSFNISGANPGELGTFFISLGILPYPYGSCTVGVDIFAPLFYLPVATSSAGTWSTFFFLPVDFTLAGLQLSAQAGLFGSTGYDVTNPQRFTIGF